MHIYQRRFDFPFLWIIRTHCRHNYDAYTIHYTCIVYIQTHLEHICTFLWSDLCIQQPLGDSETLDSWCQNIVTLHVKIVELGTYNVWIGFSCVREAYKVSIHSIGFVSKVEVACPRNSRAALWGSLVLVLPLRFLFWFLFVLATYREILKCQVWILMLQKKRHQLCHRSWGFQFKWLNSLCSGEGFGMEVI